MSQLKTIFSISKMDCPSEEKLIRMALSEIKGIKHLGFDLMGRELMVIHEGMISRQILSKLETLNLGAKLKNAEEVYIQGEKRPYADPDPIKEAKVLKTLLAINGIMFIVELGVGYSAQSTGVVADSLDMFADATVYGMSLLAVGKNIKQQTKAAFLSGWLQLALALFSLSEVVRRFIFGSEPDYYVMMSISLLALFANILCLVLLATHRNSQVHMKASWIFTANDVIANLGVIIAGAFVYFTNSRFPDLIIGTLISVVVARGACKIIKITKANPGSMKI